MGHDHVADFAESANDNPPPKLGVRYDTERFLPEAGNTVVCHLDMEDPAHHAVLDAREQIYALPAADCLLQTPIPSLHMTLMQGVIETSRSYDEWPSDLSLDAGIPDVTKVMLSRLEAFEAPPPFQVRVVDLAPSGLRLEGATPADVSRLRAWRDALTVPFKFRSAKHDVYQHHMTFAYPVRGLPDAVLPEWRAGLKSILADLVASAPVLPLHAPAFCSFADMTHFEELRVLS